MQVLCCFINNEGKICNNPACAEAALYDRNGGATYIPVCSTHGHIHAVHRFRMALERGINPEEIDNLNPQRLRHRNPETKKVKTAFEPPKPKRATNGWSWTSEFDRWRNASGKVVLFKDLHDDELRDAMHAIRRANWSRTTTKIAWMNKLLENVPPKFEYPEEELQVGRDEALGKLEELREEAVERGML